MRYLLCATLFFVACDYNDYEVYSDYCTPGKMKCENNKAYMCDEDQIWLISEDCVKKELTCYYNQPAIQSGYINLATCE